MIHKKEGKRAWPKRPIREAAIGSALSRTAAFPEAGSFAQCNIIDATHLKAFPIAFRPANVLRRRNTEKEVKIGAHSYDHWI
jgi:hypothetical protein